MKATFENTIVLIPARAGSKGVPNKNSKPFSNGISLVERAIAAALPYFEKDKIVVSTDDENLFNQAENAGVQLIKRSPELASDTAGMLEVMLDAIEKQTQKPDFLLLLQPTSPFRNGQHIEKAFELFQDGDQALVAVNEPKGHPFYTLFEEKDGFIQKFQKNQVVRRQDLAPMYDVNGLLYLFKIDDLQQKSWVEFEKIRPMVVPAWEAMDIDTQEDWWLAEMLERGMNS